jgi:hypothetical protein
MADIRHGLFALVWLSQFLRGGRALHVRTTSSLRSTLLLSAGAHSDPNSRDEKKEQFETWFRENGLKIKDVSLKSQTISVKGLSDYLRQNELNLNPDYQRGFVWKAERSARLIETVLGRRFVPPVVLHEQIDGIYDVIDGKQRLSTILAFLLGEADARAFNLPLTAVRLNPESSDDGEVHPLCGLRFIDLPPTEQRNFQHFGVDVKIVPAQSGEDLVYDIYEDINSGADDLTPQQLRRAAFSSKYMKLVDTLRSNSDLLKIRDSSEVDKKEADGEMILRAFAFSNVKIADYKPPLKKFLNKDASYMKQVVLKDEKVLIKLKKEFETTVSVIVDVFDKGASREWANGSWASKPSLWIWDTLYVVIKEMIFDSKQASPLLLQQSAGKIVAELQAKFDEGAFRSAKITGLTKYAFMKRYDLLKGVILAGLGDTLDDYRTFDRRDFSLIDDLFKDQHGLCTECGEQIHSARRYEGDYAQLDHIIPFDAGGSSDVSNSQLLHAKCNQSKGARQGPKSPGV